MTGTGRRTALLTLAAALALGGCADDQDDALEPPAPGVQASEAPVAEPTTPMPSPPRLSAEATEATRQGAKAFYAYFWEVYNYAFATGDVGPLQGLSSTDCAFCTSTITDVRDATAGGFAFTGGDVVVSDSVVAPGDPGAGLLVNSVIDQKPATTRDSDGQVVGTFAGYVGQRADATVTLVDGAWQMTGVDLVEAGDS